jgi:Ribosomal protein L11 methyltransferase (PrmA)
VSLIVDEHREYLSDRNRLDAFARAIAEQVKPGSVVVDLGAGLGIMGLLACRAGARRVYAIEETSLIELTREICRANGFEDRVTFIKNLSTHAELPEKADVVVADQIGQFGFEAGVLEYFSDARARFLKPGGLLIPSRIDLLVAPVQQEDLWRQVEFWNQSPASFNFQPARKLAVNTGYPVKLQPHQLLASAAILASLDTATCPGSISGMEASMEVEQAGTLHGIGGWFSAQLSPHVAMSNGPLGPNPIKRRNAFFPIERPVAVEKGDRVKVTMTIRPGDSMITWVVEVDGPQAAGGARSVIKAKSTHSTFHGMLLCKEDLQKTQPHFIPKLSPRGLARQSVLDLCDGRRTLSEIEQEVYRHHRQLFHSLDQAATFVAEVITRYSL